MQNGPYLSSSVAAGLRCRATSAAPNNTTDSSRVWMQSTLLRFKIGTRMVSETNSYLVCVSCLPLSYPASLTGCGHGAHQNIHK
jgi:hypothetical protein